jgi:hypothetical protein
MNKIGRKMTVATLPNRGRGRPPGAMNRVSGQAKDMIYGALVQLGGQDWLLEQAKAQPKAFMQLVAKLMPLQLGSDPDKPIGSIPIESMTEQQLLERLQVLQHEQVRFKV